MKLSRTECWSTSGDIPTHFAETIQLLHSCNVLMVPINSLLRRECGYHKWHRPPRLTNTIQRPAIVPATKTDQSIVVGLLCCISGLERGIDTDELQHINNTVSKRREER